MAISPVGSPTTNGNFSSTATGTPPTGSNGDVIVAQVTIDGQTISGAPSGYTAITSETGGSAKIYAYYRVATGSDGFSAGLAGGTSWGVALRRYSGVDNTTPLTGTATHTNSGGSNPTVAAVTPTADGAMIIGGAITNDASSTFTETAPAGVSSFTEAVEANLGRSCVYVEGLQSTAQSTGNITFTASNGFAQTAGWLAALNPAGGGGGGGSIIPLVMHHRQLLEVS